MDRKAEPGARMIPKQTERRHGPSAKITATMIFSETGYLKSILLNAQNSGDEAVLEKALDRLLKPDHIGWIRRIFKRS